VFPGRIFKGRVEQDKNKKYKLLFYLTEQDDPPADSAFRYIKDKHLYFSKRALMAGIKKHYAKEVMRLA
jgi:hypothetical protein